MKKYIISISLMFLMSQAFCQQDSSNRLTAIARSYNNKIVFRLFPTSLVSLSKANTVGYLVERANFTNDNSKTNLPYKSIKAGLIKRMPEDSTTFVFIEKNKKDTEDIKMIGLAYGVSDERAKPQQGDILKEGVTSLRERQQDESMKFFMFNVAVNRSSLAAKVTGLWAEDEEVNLGSTYMYRFKINDDIEDWYYLKVKCENFNSTYLADNRRFKMTETDERLNFTFPESTDFFAIGIDRSNFENNNYKRQNKIPEIKISPKNIEQRTDYSYADSNLINYKKYYYRIWGFTPFGDELLLGETSGVPKDKTPPPPPEILSAIHQTPKQVLITWKINEKKIADLKGFIVARGNKNEGPFKQISKGILPVTTNSFIDDTFSNEEQNYYVIEAIDTAKNTSVSFPTYVTLVDSTPPAKPIIERAIIDSTGKVIIKIKPNTEKDFAGYQLLKSNDKEHDFSVVKETYRDSSGSSIFILSDSTTLKSLTSKIYYQVIAFDSHYNQSDVSEIIELKRPDTIPPVPPIIKDFKITDSTVLLTFANSSSEDAVVNFLLRREVGKEKFDTIFYNKDVNVTKFIDQDYKGGLQYEYTMIARDDSKLISKKSRSIILKTLVKNNLPEPTIVGSYDPKTKSVIFMLKTTQQPLPQNLKLEIYKSNAIEKDWVYWKTIDNTITNPIIDKSLVKGRLNFYMVRFINEAKVVSKFSKKLEVIIGDDF